MIGRTCQIAAAAAASVWSGVAAVAGVINVPGDQPTIQAAINTAADGDEIVVASGTWLETIDLLGKPVLVRSTDPDDPAVVASTIIDGQGAGHVVQCVTGEDSDTILRGFTITGGHDSRGGGMYNVGSSPTVTGCTFTGNSAGLFGGGMYNEAGGPAVTDCTFEVNSADLLGGGMYNKLSEPTLAGCVFTGNSAASGGAMNSFSSVMDATNCSFTGNSSSGSGGGVFNEQSSTTFRSCTFGDNAASGSGGAMENFGQGSSILIDCRFIGNWAASGGGAMYNHYSAVTLVNCAFSGNDANAGGGLLNLSAAPAVTNCTFHGNTASVGGGIYNSSSNPTVVNCTFNLNASANFGGAVYSVNESSPTLLNCILWSNAPTEIYSVGSTSVAYSLVAGGFAGAGNLDVDPLFLDAAGGDLRLAPGSPCADAGHNWAVPQDALDLDGDGIGSELIPLDLDGLPRFSADAGSAGTGCGVPVVVDMGAHERQVDPVDQVYFADINGDGSVDVQDFLDLLAAWGTCQESCCPGDLDLNGQVDVIDFLALLGNWSA